MKKCLLITGAFLLACGIAAALPVTLGDYSAKAIVGGDQTIVEADLATGDRTVVSGLNWNVPGVVGTGPSFGMIMEMVAEDSTSLLIADHQGQILRIDRATGNRTLLYSPVGSEPAPEVMILEAPDQLIIGFAFPSSFLVRHTISTNARANICQISPVGSSDSYFTGLTMSASNQLIALRVNRLYTADPTTTASYSFLSSPPSASYTDLAVFPNGDFATVSWSQGPAHIDSTGTTWTTLSWGGGTGSGPAFVFPSAIAVNPNNWVYVFDSTEGAVVRVNPNDGQRVVLTRRAQTTSNPPIGSGPEFRAYYGGAGSTAMLLEGTIPFNAVDNWQMY